MPRIYARSRLYEFGVYSGKNPFMRNINLNIAFDDVVISDIQSYGPKQRLAYVCFAQI